MSVGEKAPVTAMVTEKDKERLEELAKEKLGDASTVIPLIIKGYEEMNVDLFNNLVLIILVERRTTDSGIIKRIEDTSQSAIEERAKSYHYVVDFDKTSDFPVAKQLQPGKRIIIGAEPFRIYLPEPITVEIENPGGKNGHIKYEYLYALFMHDVLGVTDGVQL